MSAFQADYFDGRSSRSKAVTARIMAESLALADETGAELVRWPLKSVRLAEIPDADGPVRLRSIADEEALLVITDVPSRAAVQTAFPHLLNRGRRHLGRLGFIAAGIVLSVAFVAMVYFGWPMIARSVAALIPVEAERQLGRQVWQQIQEMGERCEAPSDKPGLKALRRVAAELGAKRDFPFDITVHVVDWDLINAFALPGGQVVFTRGILDFMESPDEAAGVMAHELGHVLERHVMISLVQNFGLQILLTATVGTGSGLGDLSVILATASYSRGLETQADRLGLEMMQEAGFDPAGEAVFFKRILEKKEAGSFKIPLILNTHPATQDRIERSQAMAMPGAAPAMSEAEWQAVKAICRK